jgi:DNA repair protein RAD57
LCLQLCVHVQLPRSLGGLGAGAIYISTESSLVTTRLSQIAQSLTSTLTKSPPDIPEEDITTALETLASHGDQIYYYNCNDLETQEHIVTYQLPVLLARYPIGLIILDSVTANYRAEFDRAPSQKPLSQPAQMAQRSKDLRKLAGTLKDLAIEWNVAVVTANQVTDSFKRSSSQSTTQPSQQDEELLSLDYQAQWFDGLVDEKGEATKKPALGLVWTNLITSRIMLVRDNPAHTRIKVVFSPFARPASIRYAISTEAGIHAVEDHVPTEEFVADFSDLDEEELLSGHP